MRSKGLWRSASDTEMEHSPLGELPEAAIDGDSPPAPGGCSPGIARARARGRESGGRGGTWRDIAGLVEVAAFQGKLKSTGYNAAEELNKRLIAQMNPDKPE